MLILTGRDWPAYLYCGRKIIPGGGIKRRDREIRQQPSTQSLFCRAHRLTAFVGIFRLDRQSRMSILNYIRRGPRDQTCQSVRPRTWAPHRAARMHDGRPCLTKRRREAIVRHENQMAPSVIRLRVTHTSNATGK